MKEKLTQIDLKHSPHWDGEKYSAISLPQFTINKQFIEQYFFEENENILDVGCGNGDTTRLLAKLAPQGNTLGVDASPAMIESALQSNNPTNVNFALLNAQEINYQNVFDTVTCFFCMQWVPKKRMVFEKIFQALKIGGKLLLVVPLPHATLPNIRHQLIHDPKWAPYFNEYMDPLSYINDSEYELFAKQAGFSIDTYRVDQTPVTFSTYEQFFNFMLQMTPHVSQIPLRKNKEDFVHQLLNLYLQDETNTADDGYQLLFRLVKFCGKKITL